MICLPGFEGRVCSHTGFIMIKFNPLPPMSGKTVTLAGILINGFLILVKLAAGIFGHSQALIADAIHSVSDLFTDGVVLFGISIGKKSPDETHPFGHARIETLASAVLGFVLVFTALYIGINASVNIYQHTESHPTILALYGAAISIVLKEGLYHLTVYTGRQIKCQLIVANAWHHRSDALSSVAVLIGVGGAYFKPSWHILDSFAALLVSFFIIKVGLEIIANSLREFTDKAPSPEVLKKIGQCAMSVDGILDLHDLRVRISGGLYQMETHVVVDGDLTVSEGHRIATVFKDRLIREIEDMDRVIIHVDPSSGANDTMELKSDYFKKF